MSKKTIRSEVANYSTVGVLGGLEVVNAKYHHQNFSKHVHEGYTVAVIERGAQRFYRTGGNHLAGENSIILVNADDVHTGQSATEGGWSYRALYPTPEQFEWVCRDVFKDSRVAPYFPEAVVDDSIAAKQLRLLFDCLTDKNNTLYLETTLYAFMTGLVLRHSKDRKKPTESANSKPALSLVRDYIHDHYNRNITLEELARLGGMSPFHMLRQFKKANGLAPHQYQIQVRVKNVQRLLKAGMPAAMAATECGFHDQSHLNNHFKKVLGTTPVRYQKQGNFLQ